MSRLDVLQKIIDETKPIPGMVNPKAEKILRSLIEKAIPMTDYIDKRNITEAIYGDAIDEGLSATDIHIAIKKIYKSCGYIGYSPLLIGVDRLAEEQMNAERVAERAANLARMDEDADGET